MEPFNQLFAQYNPGDIIIILILVLLCVKTLGEAISWAYKNLKEKINKDTQTEQVVEQQDAVDDKIAELSKNVKKLCDTTQSIQSGLDDLSRKQDVLKEKMSTLEDNQHDIQERFQYYTRVFIIDKYHYHCYKTHQIDEVTMDSLENQYTQYKQHGGNSFIDGLMDRLRALPLAEPEDNAEGR